MTILLPNSSMKILPSDSATLISMFQEAFSSSPQWKVITPGRVNLIGEHTDYNLLPVLPMPLDRSITILIAPRNDNRVRLTNIDPSFSPAEFSLAEDIELQPNHWSNYARAAIKTIIPAIISSGQAPRGFDALVHSDLPPAAGLSSSSALVIGTCLTFLQVNDLSWSMTSVAEQMRLAEQFVGTAGGGMDQAVISLGCPGSALMVEFDPLTTTPVAIPDDLRIYVINSGQKAEKSGAARFAYNRRALECALAVELLRQYQSNGLDNNSWESLRDVYSGATSAAISWSELIQEILPVEPVTSEWLTDRIGQERLADLCAGKKLDYQAIEEWLPDDRFHLYARASHVLGETDRVYSFAESMATGDLQGMYYNAQASHASCRDLYHISTPRIEALIYQTLQAGAEAARITGAGFGGCIVVFVSENQCGRFLETMQSTSPSPIIEAKSNGHARIEMIL